MDFLLDKEKMQDFYILSKEEFLNYLWEDFEYIDIDKNGNILEDFYIWKKGTDRGDIWEWFDIR